VNTEKENIIAAFLRGFSVGQEYASERECGSGSYDDPREMVIARELLHLLDDLAPKPASVKAHIPPIMQSFTIQSGKELPADKPHLWTKVCDNGSLKLMMLQPDGGYAEVTAE